MSFNDVTLRTAIFGLTVLFVQVAIHNINPAETHNNIDSADIGLYPHERWLREGKEYSKLYSDTVYCCDCSLRNSEFGHVTLYSDCAPTWLTGQPWFDSLHGLVSIFPRNIVTCWGTHNSSDLWVLAGICRRLNELGPADDISLYLASRFRMYWITLFLTQQPKPFVLISLSFTMISPLLNSSLWHVLHFYFDCYW